MIMKLIRFEERLVEVPYGMDFKGYLIIQLDMRDMQDIMLLKSHLDEDLFKITDFNQGVMEIVDRNIFRDIGVRREDKIDALNRLHEQMNLILRTELRETPTSIKGSALWNYRDTLRKVENAVQDAKHQLSRRYKNMQKCIEELTKEEIDTLGLNVNYAEFAQSDFLAIAYKEKDSLSGDGDLIESLESLYRQDIN